MEVWREGRGPFGIKGESLLPPIMHPTSIPAASKSNWESWGTLLSLARFLTSGTTNRSTSLFGGRMIGHSLLYNGTLGEAVAKTPGPSFGGRTNRQPATNRISSLKAQALQLLSHVRSEFADITLLTKSGKRHYCPLVLSLPKDRKRPALSLWGGLREGGDIAD